MPDDEIRNLIPGNNPNGPSVTPFANRYGQGSPPLASYDQPLSGGMNLDAATLLSLMDSGVGASVIADMLPQLDTGLPSRAESLVH